MRRQRKMASMSGAAILPGCAGTKEEIQKEKSNMKAKKIVALVLAFVMVLALGTSALATESTMSNPVTVPNSNITLRFGDPDYPATAPECNMYFRTTSAANTYDAIYSTDGATASTSFYPSILAFYVSGTINSLTGTDIDFVTYADDGTPTVSDEATINEKGFYTIKPKSSNSKIVLNETVTVNFAAPKSTAAASGSIAKAICGYLPVGQFARYNSFGWGTIFTDNTNVYTAGKQAKFVSADGTGTSYVATGVSLGIAGGYVQFDMGTDEDGNDILITNNPNNKYGIDFIVYGNAFVGNPEAGIVKVSQDGKDWYTLAGSRHYMDGTKWNQNISYIRIANKNTTISGKTFATAGIYTSTNFTVPATDSADAVNTAIGEATWTGIAQLTGSSYPKTLTTDSPVNAAWWPEWENDGSGNAENYGQVWKIGNDGDLDDVSWLRSGAAEVITYKNVTTVEDDTVVLNRTLTAAPTQAQMTDVYQWGYADVRTNGSAYGTISNNPYADAASAVGGGDGFDLSWAVDDNGVPVPLEGVRYIRVYSGVLFNAGIFGETSTEVCGLYVANAESSSVGTTAAPTTVSIGNYTINPRTDAENKGNNVYYYSTENGLSEDRITVASVDGAKVFINGVETSSLTLSENAEVVQILVQGGNAAPYILVIK